VSAGARSDRAAPQTPEAANLGWVRPPLVYLGAIGVGVGLELAWPLPFLPHGIAAPLGLLLVVAAVTLFAASARRFRAAGTPLPGNRPTTVIVRRGPYRLSRNPIYLAFSLLQLGVAVWVNGAWLLVTLAAAVGLMALVVIPREEAYLAKRFGSEYLAYKTTVRRWL
jgi:protein-S-isoprenylcysteine O-methyltransferase Ste14